jgi:hypothetical protein
MLIKGVYRFKLYLNYTIVLMNNIIDISNNYIIAIDTIIKYPFHLLSNKSTLII